MFRFDPDDSGFRAVDFLLATDRRLVEAETAKDHTDRSQALLQNKDGWFQRWQNSSPTKFPTALHPTNGGPAEITKAIYEALRQLSYYHGVNFTLSMLGFTGTDADGLNTGGQETSMDCLWVAQPTSPGHQDENGNSQWWWTGEIACQAGDDYNWYGDPHEPMVHIQLDNVEEMREEHVMAESDEFSSVQNIRSKWHMWTDENEKMHYSAFRHRNDLDPLTFPYHTMFPCYD